MVAVLEVWCSSERSSLHLTKEEEQGGVQKHLLTSADVLCIVSFVFLNFYSFFATGNIASLNSFDPSSIPPTSSTPPPGTSGLLQGRLGLGALCGAWLSPIALGLTVVACASP